MYRTTKEGSPAVSAGPTSGRDYLMARSRDLSERSTTQEQLREQVRELHQALGEVSAECVRNQPQDAALSGRREQMLLNGAYLVPRGDTRLESAVRELQRIYGERGVSYELTGPWPPYNFVPRDLGGM